MPNLKTYSMTGPNLLKLHKKIKKSNCVTDFEGLVENDGVVDVIGSAISDVNKLDSDITSHDSTAEPLPTVVSLAKNEAKSKHFHNIDYTIELTVRLQKTVTFGEPGLLTKAELFEDDSKTVRVLDVEREYEIDAVSGKLIRKKTIRKYYNQDGTINPDSKDPGWYTYTPEESRDATHRRRRNITNKLEADMLSMLVASAGGNQTQETANVAAGAAFMSAISAPINVFHQSGDNSSIVAMVSDTTTQTDYPFLLADVAPGVKAFQFIIAGVTY